MNARRILILGLCLCNSGAYALGVVQDVAADAAVGVAKGVAQAVTSDAPAKRTRPTAVSKKAPVRPQASPLEPRLVTFPYTSQYIYPIPAKLDAFTHLELAENERVVGFFMEDKIRWTFKVAATKRDVFVKPIVSDATTPATLITNLRRYELSFTSCGDDADGICSDGTWYQRVSWEATDGSYDASEVPLPRNADAMSLVRADGIQVIPAGQNATGAMIQGAATLRPLPTPCGQDRVQVDRLNFNYTVVGEAPFKPTMVFDDGHFTWFKFPKVQDMPPLFALDPSTGEAQLEPFIPCKDHFLVQALLPGGALLKLGKDEVRIVNKNNQDCGGIFSRSCKPIANIRD